MAVSLRVAVERGCSVRTIVVTVEVSSRWVAVEVAGVQVASRGIRMILAARVGALSELGRRARATCMLRELLNFPTPTAPNAPPVARNEGKSA